MLYTAVKISPRQGGRYRILEDIIYKDIAVPAGYVTNGADIPRWLWWYIPPNWSDILPAVIVHDYLIAMGNDDHKADRYFAEILEGLGIPKYKRLSLILGVKFYTKYIRK